jgi:UDP-N-acetylglucosamine pyrophosphorylase
MRHRARCPPGHGDIYPSLLGSGMLDALVSEGIKYLFVSNSDNLGATLDLQLLQHFASTNAPFMMEVCERTAADKKGGHLARRKADGELFGTHAVLMITAVCSSPRVDLCACLHTLFCRE